MGSFSPPAIGRSGAAEESAASPMGGAGRAAASAMTELLKTNGAPGVSSSMPLPIDPRWGTEVSCSGFALPLEIHRREGAAVLRAPPGAHPLPRQASGRVASLVLRSDLAVLQIGCAGTAATGQPAADGLRSLLAPATFEVPCRFYCRGP